jgi:hypothetical protein
MRRKPSWLVEKVVVPLGIVMVSGVIGAFAIPQILYLRDQKHTADAFRVTLIQETAEETAALANAVWQHEDALDAAFRNAHEAQTELLRQQIRAACGHKLAAPANATHVKTSREGWIADAVDGYHNRFRNHQVWAIRSKIRARFLFADGQVIESTLGELENAIGEWNETLVSRRDAFDGALTARQNRVGHAISEHRAGRLPHAKLHDLPDLSISPEAVIKQQKAQDFSKADTSQEKLFVLLRESDMETSLASLLKPPQ